MPDISSTVVDLSRLPAPAIVELLDFDTIKAAMLADLAARWPDFSALVESDPAYKLVEICAYREQLLRQAANDAGLQLMAAYATGPNLDQLAALLGVSRLLLAPATDTTDDVYETDDALRQRLVLAPEAYSVAGPELAYVARAKAASGAVADASATSPAPGDILVSVLATDGDGTAPADLIATVNAAVTGKAVRPLGDLVTTASAEIVDYAIAASLTTFDGPDVDLVLTAARTSLDAWLADNRLLGRNHRTAGLIAALKVAGVEDVVLTSPADDILCSLAQAAHATTIAIDHAGVA